MTVRCLALSILFATAAHAQERVYTSGFVNDINSLQPLGYVNISVGGKVIASTDQNGFFSFAANLNDTIIFTRLGYQPHELISAENNWDERIFLSEMSKMLNEVIIYDRYQIHGSEEIKKGTDQKDAQFDNFTMNPQNQNSMIQTFGPSVSFGAPWNNKDKDSREKKKLQAVISEKQRTTVYHEFIHSAAVEEYFKEQFTLDQEGFLKFKEGFIIANPDARYLTQRKDIIDLMFSYFASRKP